MLRQRWIGGYLVSRVIEHAFGRSFESVRLGKVSVLFTEERSTIYSVPILDI